MYISQPQYHSITQPQPMLLFNLTQFTITFTTTSQLVFPFSFLLNNPVNSEMGNQIPLPSSDSRGKVVFWDGSVHGFDTPLTVAELMLDHPQQVVVELHSAINQKRPTPLPADKKLEMNKIYLMVPIKRGKPVGLSSEETRRILFIINSAIHSKDLLCSSRFLPWLARLCQTTTIADGGPNRVAQRKEERDENEERNEFSEFLSEMLQGRPEYLTRQVSGKGWKPSLDTIKEKNIERKLTHWLFLKNF